MKPTRQLQDLGQSLWLDNITRELLDNGTLRGYIEEFSVTGLTSNPTIFDEAIGGGQPTTTASARRRRREVRRSAVHRAGAGGPAPRRRLFRPVFDASRRRRRLGVDGGVAAAGRRHRRQHRGGRAQIHRAGRPAEPVRQDSRHARRDSGDRGVDLRGRADQRDPAVLARAVSRRRRGLSARHRAPHRRRARPAGRLGRLAVRQPLGQRGRGQGAGRACATGSASRSAQRTYRAYRELLASPRWRELAAAGARPQRLLWASTGTKDPEAPDTLYVEALAAPDTINTIPEKTLLAFAEHGTSRGADGRRTAAMPKLVLARFAKAGVDIDALALQLQREGAQAFVKSWQQLLQRIADKSAALAEP